MDRIINVPKRSVNLWKDRWIWRIAWKDASKNWARLLVFLSSIVTGIAAFVSVLSFNSNLRNDIDNQAKALLGADLVLYNEKAFAEIDSLLAQIAPNRQATDARFNSMVRFPFRNETRLAQIVAVEGDYPFYGQLETLPDYALEQFREGNFALLDDHLAFQHEISTGDTLRIGDLAIPVAGIVTKMPGNVRIMSNLSPSVYIPFGKIEATGLLQKGSRVSYRKYFEVMLGQTPEILLESLQPIINQFGLGYETVAYRKESLGSSFENLYRFLNLAAFIALIIGSAGVAGAVHIYTREKYYLIALLRCLGATSGAAFWMFFIQVAALGLLGSVIGALLGSGLQYLLPAVLADLLPLEMSMHFSWPSFGVGIFSGMAITLLFASFPMVNLRQVPPLATLRNDYGVKRGNGAVKWLLGFLTVAINWGLTVYLTRDWLMGSLFFANLVGVLALLFTLTLILLWLVRHVLPKSGLFVLKQGFANLYRPHNQTLLLVMVIGFTALMIASVTAVQSGILRQVDVIGRQNQANLVLYDIQPDQLGEVKKLITDQQIEARQFIPIVTMRISKINNRTPSEMQADSVSGMIPNWLLYMEHPTTYRNYLLETEQLVAGSLPDSARAIADSAQVSITEGLAENLRLNIGDKIDFNLHGTPFRAYVGSIRKIDWQQLPSNFAFVFPEGYLEQAPRFYAALLHAPSTQGTAYFKQVMAQQAPNVSVVDLNLLLRTLNQVASKIAFVIRFVSVFSVLASLLVLVTSVMNSKYARVRENALLRTLGANNVQLVGIALIEYCYIGLFASVAGAFLSILAVWMLGGYFLEIVLKPDYWQLAGIVAGITAVTVAISFLNLRHLFRRPPLEVLQKEVGSA